MIHTTTIPLSTYRLHLTGAFTLLDAAAMVDYLHDLGVDWMYASPIQTVPAGATHGYHITDPDSVNPELGGESGLQALHESLTQRSMGLVLDIVPNHMAASPDNPWWLDVLAHGPESPHAATFDIDFAAGPIVLPVLGASREEAIAEGSISIVDGQLDAGGLRLPLAAHTDLDASLPQILAAQHYALHEWRSGEAQLNWRRFFAVNDLAGVRVEDPEVFDLIHDTILGWVGSDVLQGIRVDHIDGLRDPAAYLHSLRRHLAGSQDLTGSATSRWLVVEKILEQGEDLPDGWPVEGTTGYEVGANLLAWQTNHDGHQHLRRAFADLTGLPANTVEALPVSKLVVLDELFPAEVARIADRLPLATSAGVQDLLSRDEAIDGVRHLTAHLSGYRTYADAEGPLGLADQDAIERAAAAATATGHPEAARVAALLDLDEGREALLRWQQLTGPAAAKGFEDRLLFQQVALSSLCEVGADAHYLDRLPEPAAVTAFLSKRAATGPSAGATTSTHDTKRSEDVRARVTVLAEMPTAFLDLLTAVTASLASGGVETDAHASWLLIQTVLGTMDLAPRSTGDSTQDADPPAPTNAYRSRLHDFAEKALREADLRTGHRSQDADYEQGVHAWLDALLDPGTALDALQSHVRRIAIPAACNSLATALLKIAGPGVPDIYRGCEVWDDSLTDPDNRRPLDVAALRDTLAGLENASPEVVRDRWRDGGLKMLLTTRALRARRDNPSVFASTRCDSPDVSGERAGHVMALLRTADDRGPFGVADPGSQPRFLALATRLPLGMADGGWPIGGLWASTSVDVAGSTAAVDVITGRPVPVTHASIQLSDAFATLPVALLEIS